jgi:hypothetical protein
MKLIGGRSRRTPLGWGSRCRLEASLWGGLAIIAWESFPILKPEIAAAWAPFAEWMALGLAGIATLMAFQVKRKLHDQLTIEDKQERVLEAPNPLSLIELLREHGVREFGSMYLYMPMPKRLQHEAAWDWIDTLAAEGLIKGDPWHIKADHVKETVRKSHAHLFSDEPGHFDVYRLDWQTLSKIMEEELV